MWISVLHSDVSLGDVESNAVPKLCSWGCHQFILTEIFGKVLAYSRISIPFGPFPSWKWFINIQCMSLTPKLSSIGLGLQGSWGAIWFAFTIPLSLCSSVTLGCSSNKQNLARTSDCTLYHSHVRVLPERQEHGSVERPKKFSTEVTRSNMTHDPKDTSVVPISKPP